MLQVLHWHDLQWVKCRVWDHTHPKLGGAFTTGKLGGFGVKPNKSISTAADAQHEGVHLFHTKNAFIQQASKLCQKNPNMKVKNVRLRDQGSFNERLTEVPSECELLYPTILPPSKRSRPAVAPSVVPADPSWP